MKYSDAIKAREARRPIATVEVPPRVWAQTWTDRPVEVVTIGLRSLGETMLSQIGGLATTHANRCVPGGDESSARWVEELSAAIRFYTLARALCRPECADVPWWDYPDMVAPIAFEPAGAAWLYARYSVAVVSKSVLGSEEAPEALGAELATAMGRAATLPPAKRSQVACHLRAALDVLEGR